MRSGDSGPLEDVSSEAADVDRGLLGPCIDDGQCARPSIACATFYCDRVAGRCRAISNDAVCDDHVYCNGLERCDPLVGCVLGPVVECAAGDGCLLDRCDENAHQCVTMPRDLDGDGDSDSRCALGGGDCDDRDRTVSSKASEVCGNGKDDNCNGKVDELPCIAPEHSTCDSALVLTEPGTVRMSFRGTARTMAASCAGADFARQLVVALHVRDADVGKEFDLVATESSGARVALVVGKACGDGSTEVACVATKLGVATGRLLLSKPAGGILPLYLLSTGEGDVELRLQVREPTGAATNDRCERAALLSFDGSGRASAVARLATVAAVPTACDVVAGPLLYRVDVPSALAPADLTLRALADRGQAEVYLGLRDEVCEGADHEKRCGSGRPAQWLLRGLPAGIHYVSVGSSEPADVLLEATLAPARPPPPTENCTNPPPLPLDETTIVDLAGHAPDIAARCLTTPLRDPLAPDAAFALHLATPSDVLLLLSPGGADQASVGLFETACSSAKDACGFGYPMRVQRRAVPAGDHRVVVQSALGVPVALSAFVRPTTAPGPVGAASCADPIAAIGASGGYFEGSTKDRVGRVDASCDRAGQVAGGAPEAIYRLDLPKASRVLIDAMGSDYPAIVNVRRGTGCPGAEMPRGCSAGLAADNAFVELELQPDSYWIVVDGVGGASGNYHLDVRIVASALVEASK